VRRAQQFRFDSGKVRRIGANSRELVRSLSVNKEVAGPGRRAAGSEAQAFSEELGRAM
jgi:hypothetical protein